MSRCSLCGKESPRITQCLDACVDLIRDSYPQPAPRIKTVHQATRRRFGLPVELPQDQEGRSNAPGN